MTITRQAFSKAVLEEKESLWSYALHLTRHYAEAEDLLQMTYVRAFERWEQLRELKSMRAWLIRIMHRVFVDRYRQGHKMNFESLQETWKEVSYPPHFAARTEARNALDKALKALPPVLAQSLTLRDLWGFSYQEISVLMDCPVGTVRSRISRARAQVLNILRPKEKISVKAYGGGQGQ